MYFMGVFGRNKRNECDSKSFGQLSTGEEISVYHLENRSGAYAEVLQYGAI